MKTIILIISFLFVPLLVCAQISSTYYLEISNKDYIPTVTNKIDGTIELKVNISLENSAQINLIFDSFTVYNFADIFSEAITGSNLKNKYVITLSLSDDITDLTNVFTQYYPSYIVGTVYEPLTPTEYLPDDFENTDLLLNVNVHNTDYEQHALRMIRATEAWDITEGIPEVIIGIADQGFDVGDGGQDLGHEDLRNEFIGGLINYNNQYGAHGNFVAGFASAETDNDLGISSIGFKTKMIGARDGTLDNLLGLAQFNLKPKVVNLSFGSDGAYNQDDQDIVNMISALDVTIVIAGGNGPDSGTGSSSTYYYPASYQNVIAVSTVGNKNDIGSTSLDYDNWKDVHDIVDPDNNHLLMSHQHNDSIDIVVPAYYLGVLIFKDPNHDDEWKDDYRTSDIGGTSFSAPIVAGTVGLMNSVNYCIEPKEVETILKLTAVKIDNLPQNIQYYGKLGAGRLDAYEAVKMSKDMADTFGTVEVKDRILYRPWFYKLVTAPYEIKMINNDVTGGSKLKFRARNNIEILSGDYYPQTGGYIDLAIDGTLALDCPPPPSLRMSNTNNVKNAIEISYDIYPTLVEKDIEISSKTNSLDEISVIKVYNFYGVEVVSHEKFHNDKLSLNLENLNEGIYIVKIYNAKGENVHTQKIIKNSK